MGIFTRLIGDLLGVLFRTVVMAIFIGVVGAGATLLVASQSNHHWPPSLLTEITAGVIGVLAGYAAATTTLLRAIGKGVTSTAKAAEGEVDKVVPASR